MTDKQQDASENMESQEVETAEDYSVFTLDIRPTYDFVGALAASSEELEVLEPSACIRAQVHGTEIRCPYIGDGRGVCDRKTPVWLLRSEEDRHGTQRQREAAP